MAKTSESGERRLIEQAREGDDSAFAALCRANADLLEGRIARRLSPRVRRRVSISDVLQETWVAAHRKLGDFEYRGKGSFQAWLARIAELVTLQAVQHHTDVAKRAVDAEVPKESVVGRAPARVASPSHMAMGAELDEAVQRALAELPPDHRRVIECIQQLHLGIEGTAREMERSPNAVKKLYARALQGLAERLGIPNEES